MTDSPPRASAPSPLPPKPSLGLLSSLAKQLRKAQGAGEPSALARLKSHHPRFKSASSEQIGKGDLSLRDAQLVIAREHGFETWALLKQHVLSLHEGSAGEAVVKQLMEAAERGDVGLVRSILDDHPTLVDARGGEGSRTALHRAAWKGHPEVVELLLDRGADPTIRDVGDNATPLHFAAEHGSLDVVKLLIDYGGDPSGFGDVHGQDVIGWATTMGQFHREVAEYLLARDAQHNIFSAVAMGDVEAIKALAAISRDVMDKPMAIWEERRRPLHLAVIKKQPRVIPVLLDLGADINATNIEDLTPLDQAALLGQSESVNILLDRGARVSVPAAFVLQRSEAMERILDEDPEILKPGNRWGGLIHAAASHSPRQVIENLIAHGASVHVRVDSKAFGTKGYTPLHSASWTGNLAAMAVLIEHGAALDVEDGTYKATPLGWATYAGRTEAAEMLRARGAK